MDNKNSSSSRYLRHKDVLARHFGSTTNNVSTTAPADSVDNKCNATSESTPAVTAAKSRRLEIMNSRWMGSASSSAEATTSRSVSVPKQRSPTAAFGTATSTAKLASKTAFGNKSPAESIEAKTGATAVTDQRLSRLQTVRRSMSAPKQRQGAPTKKGEGLASTDETAASPKQQLSSSRLGHRVLMIPARPSSSGRTSTASKSSTGDETGTVSRKQVQEKMTVTKTSQNQQHCPVALKPLRFATSTVKSTESIENLTGKKEDDGSGDMVSQMIVTARRFKASASSPDKQESAARTASSPDKKDAGSSTKPSITIKSRSEAVAAASISLGARRFRAMPIDKKETATEEKLNSNKSDSSCASITVEKTFLAAAPKSSLHPADSKSVASNASNNTSLSSSRLQSQMRSYKQPIDTSSVSHLKLPATSMTENDARSVVSAPSTTQSSPIGMRVYRNPVGPKDHALLPADSKASSSQTFSPAKPQMGIRVYRPIGLEQSPLDQQPVTMEKSSSKKPHFLGLRAYRNNSSGASVASAPPRVVSDATPLAVLSVTTPSSLRLSEELAKREQEALEKKNESRIAEMQRAKADALRAKRDAAKRIVKGSPEHRQNVSQHSPPQVKPHLDAAPAPKAAKRIDALTVKHETENGKHNFIKLQQQPSESPTLSATDRKNSVSPVSSTSPKTTLTTQSPSSWQERKNKAKEIVMRRGIAGTRRSGSHDSVASVDAGSQAGSNAGDGSTSPSVGANHPEDAIPTLSWTEEKYKASREHRAMVKHNSVPCLSSSHTTTSFEMAQPLASIVSNLTTESFSDALSTDAWREVMHPAVLDDLVEEKQPNQYQTENQESQRPPSVLDDAATSPPDAPTISGRDRMELLRADSSGSQESARMDGICGLLEEHAGGVLNQSAIVLSPPRRARVEGSHGENGQNRCCESNTPETGSDDDSSVDGYRHARKHTSFDFRPLADNAEDVSAVVESSWDSSKVLFNEYSKAAPKNLKHKNDDDINPFQSTKSAAEEMKENCPAAAVTASILTLQIDTEHNDLDPLGWPRSPPGLMNVETKTDPFGSQESSASELDDGENLLSGHNRSEDFESESILSAEEAKAEQEESLKASLKAERLEIYKTRLDDESSRGLSDEEEKMPEADDDSDGFGEDAGIVDFCYISQDSEEDEDVIRPQKESASFASPVQIDPTNSVPTFDPAMMLAHEAETNRGDENGTKNDKVSSHATAPALNEDTARLTSQNSADSTGSGTSRGLPPSGKPSLQLPMPPPPPPPGRRRKRTNSRKKGLNQSVPLLPPPPDEKLKQWEQSQVTEPVCFDKEEFWNDVDDVRGADLRSPSCANIKIESTSIHAAAKNSEVAKYESKSPSSALFIFSKSSDTDEGDIAGCQPDVIETVDTVDSLLSTYQNKMFEDTMILGSECAPLDTEGVAEHRKELDLRAAIPENGLSPFTIAVTSEPQIISNILDFLGDPVAVCRMKMLDRTCCCYVDQNEHKLVRDAVRLGGMSMNVRPYFWLWVTLEKGTPLVPKNDEESEEDVFDPLTPSSSEIAALERKGRSGKWHHVIERDVARAFGNLPPHKTGARLRTDSIVRALVSWGQNRVVKRSVKGSGNSHLRSCDSKDSGDVSLTPTDTVSDWGGVTPVGSFGGSCDDTSCPGEQERKKKRRSSNGSVEVAQELVLNGNAMSEEMKVALQAKLSFILHALAAEHEDVGYCQGMDYVVAHLLRILQDTIRWKAAHGTLPSAVKSNFNRFDSGIGKDRDVKDLYAEIDRSLVVEDTCFRVMSCFFTSYSLQHFYWPELRCLKTCCRVFEKLIKIKLPVLADHFEHHELNVGLFALGWFQTLFLYLPSMPSATVCHMWDIWLVERSFKIFFRVGTAILFLSQPILLNHDLEGMMSYLNTFPDATLLSPDILIACANQIKVTNTMLMELENEVKNSTM